MRLNESSKNYDNFTKVDYGGSVSVLILSVLYNKKFVFIYPLFDNAMEDGS